MSNIFLIGAARSGTTLLGNLLSTPKSHCYIEEPNVIWRYRNFAIYGHDEFSPSDAGDEIKSYIVGWFSKRISKSGKTFFLEKTPSNALRSGFVREIFPEGKYIFIFRDPFDTICSALDKWESDDNDSNAVRLNDNKKYRQGRIQLKKLFMIPLRDIIFYIPTIVSELTHKLFGRRRSFWGPCFKGYKEYKGKRTIAVCEQYIRCYENMRRDMALSDNINSLSITYSSLISHPEDVCGKIENFVGLSSGEIDFSLVSVKSSEKAQTKTRTSRERLKREISQDMLRRLDQISGEIDIMSSGE